MRNFMNLERKKLIIGSPFDDELGFLEPEARGNFLISPIVTNIGIC